MIMSILIAISTLLLLTSCSGQEYLPGNPVSSVNRIEPTFLRNAVLFDATDPVPTPDPNTLCAGKYGPICANCHTQVTCANEVINRQTCSSIDPTKPYCVDSVCTNATTSAGSCTVPFRCTSTGQFPNPNDCTTFYFCTGSSVQSTIMYRCPLNYVYDSLTRMCKQKKVTSDCLTISCTGLSNRYQIFAGDKSILAYCADTPTIQETILFRCKDHENMHYDQETLQCKYVCTVEGRFPDRLDCKKYYECYKVGTQFQVEHIACPIGFSYNAVRKQCTVAAQCTPELT